MSSSLSALPAAELISKGIAPVKREYWKPILPRQEVAAVGSSNAPENGTSAPVERKSRRQAKRVSCRQHWQCGAKQLSLLTWSKQSSWYVVHLQNKPFCTGVQERDAGINLCINFLAGNCEFAQDCRYSHDIQGYLAQKPRELPGQCPFSAAARCPYGRRICCLVCVCCIPTSACSQKLLCSSPIHMHV